MTDRIGTFVWERDSHGIVTLTLDDPSQSANTINSAFIASIGETLDRIDAERHEITGIVLTSAKKTFFAGRNLDDLLEATQDDAAELADSAGTVKFHLRRLETIGVPVVAALGGSAIGCGFEIALATHHRIAVDSDVCVGLPDVTLGLLPGAGGTVRTVRLLGIEIALAQLLLAGRLFHVSDAVKLGLIDEVVADPDELVPAAKAWIKANPAATMQPWDREGFRIPNGDPSSPSFASQLPAMTANLRKNLNGAPLPAPRAILAAAIEGAAVDFDTASRIETRYFVKVATGQVAKNMINAFFDTRTVIRDANRPRGLETPGAFKIGVVGTGAAGADLAYVAACAGIDAVLLDSRFEEAANGKFYTERIEAENVTPEECTGKRPNAVLARILPNSLPDSIGVDFILEFVRESIALINSTPQEIESLVRANAVFEHYTPTAPTGHQTACVSHREDCGETQFFSPPAEINLVEIVADQHTTHATLAKAFDLARQLGKLPILVNDLHGSFSSRVINAYLSETISLIGEGVSPVVVEQAARQAGYSVGPLQLLDELTLTLFRTIRRDSHAATEGPLPADSSGPVLDKLIDQLGRCGRSTGSGFYDYEDGSRVRLWPRLSVEFSSVPTRVPFEDLKERMLFVEALEAVRCVDEGVIRTVAEANVGSIHGIGYPTWTGGVLQYINGYPGGLQAFIKRSTELAYRYGNHLEPPKSLMDKAARGLIFQ